MLRHPSLADNAECWLVEQLTSNAFWHSRLFNIKGIPDGSRTLSRLSLRELTGAAQGDVDILLAPPNHPEFSTAIEVKRIKVSLATFRDRPPNKLGDFQKGIRQANQLAKIGFWQVYLYAFVVVDSRQRNAGRYGFKGLTPELDRIIRRTIRTDGLAQRVGLIRHDFVQSMDDPPLATGTFSAHLLRLAKAATQPENVTMWAERKASARSPSTDCEP